MIYLYVFTGLALLISFLVDRKKTYGAVRIAFKRFAAIAPAFLTMLILISIGLYFVSADWIADHLGNSTRFAGVLLASILGSVALMPGFIAYPLCGILLKQGVPYMILAAFSTTLMMVGVLTYPIERKCFGHTVTIIRNAVCFFIALAVAGMVGLYFGEVW